MSKLPLVSILIPCRNEGKYIRHVLNDLLQQDYDKEKLEIFFLDGMSNDKTREIIKEFAAQYTFIELLDNSAKFVPQAMNMGIQQSRGEVIIRMDAHSSYPPEYVSKLVNWLYRLNADNVGGMWNTKPSSNNLKAAAIAFSLSHPFGVGNTYYRIGIDKPMEADTVPFGCYRKSVFDKIGRYNNKLVRNQDIELNKRLKKAGGIIYLVPDVSCTYFARDTFTKLFENNYGNGKWVILTVYYTRELKSLALRHFVPLFFTVYLITVFLLITFSRVFILPILFYIALTLYFSIRIALKENKLFLIPFVMTSFLILHISYGIGSLVGIASVFRRYMKKQIDAKSL